MTKPSVSKEEMLDTLEHCRLTMTFHEVQALAGKWNEHDEEVIRAIRAALINEERMREKVGELKNRAQGILSNPDLMDEPDIFEFIKDIRDFKLDGEGEK